MQHSNQANTCTNKSMFWWWMTSGIAHGFIDRSWNSRWNIETSNRTAHEPDNWPKGTLWQTTRAKVIKTDIWANRRKRHEDQLADIKSRMSESQAGNIWSVQFWEDVLSLIQGLIFYLFFIFFENVSGPWFISKIALTECCNHNKWGSILNCPEAEGYLPKYQTKCGYPNRRVRSTPCQPMPMWTNGWTGNRRHPKRYFASPAEPERRRII